MCCLCEGSTSCRVVFDCYAMLIPVQEAAKVQNCDHHKHTAETGPDLPVMQEDLLDMKKSMMREIDKAKCYSSVSGMG